MTEWNADAYQRISALQQAMAAEALALVHFEGWERVLDVGCGNGRITVGLLSQVPEGEVTGIDASTGMIQFATEAAETVGLQRLHYAVADARYLEFESEFDVAVSFNALHWIPEQHLALASLRRALRPNGWAQVRLVPKGERTSIEEVLESVLRSGQWAAFSSQHQDPYLHLTADAYSELADKSGFTVESLRVTDHAWDFQSYESFHRFLQVTTVAWTNCLPESAKDDFLNDVQSAYRQVACQGPGEEQTFRFYQMDVKLRGKQQAPAP